MMQCWLYRRKTRHTAEHSFSVQILKRTEVASFPTRSAWIISCSEKKVAIAAVWLKSYNPCVPHNQLSGGCCSIVQGFCYCEWCEHWIRTSCSSEGAGAGLAQGRGVLLFGHQEIKIQFSSLLQSLFLILDESFNLSVIQFMVSTL